ncbi:MAG TPA: ATP-binding protein [Leptolyngbyaceae cyanobacterium]
MKGSLEKRAIAGSFGVVLLLLGFASLISTKNTTELVESTAKVQQTYEILVSLTDFNAAMSTAESGRRGYIFTGKATELERHKAAVRSLRAELEQIEAQLSHDPSQQEQVAELERLLKQRLTLFQQSIEIYKQNPSAVQDQSTITSQSIRLREKIQITLARLKSKEQERLKTSLESSQINIKQRFLLEQLSTVLMVIVLLGAAFLLYQEQKRQQRLQALEQSLAQERELSDLKLRLFSMVSHEFRTPLSVILASSQLLDEILASRVEPTLLKNLSRIQTSAKLMNQLLTDILTVTRAEAGKLEYRPEFIDVEAFCLNLLDDIQSSNSEHSLKFTRQGRCGRVYFDEKLLYSILSNLLLNAVKYSPIKSQIDLTLACESSTILFEIQDRGIGILLEDQEKIFDPFYRGKNAERISGSGLGLSVVKKCLELCNGSIQVESEIGVGTRFVVSIPSIQPQAPDCR